MRRFFIVVAAAILVSRSQVAGQELRVFPVDLEGDPRNNVEVSLRDENGRIVTSKSLNGVATLKTNLNSEFGKVTLAVNVKRNSNSNFVTGIVPRVKEISWGDGDQDFDLGFVVPLWDTGDIKKYAEAIVSDQAELKSRFQNSQFTQGPAITQPRFKRVTVAVRFDDNAPGGAFIVAKAADTDATWIEQVAPTLPMVNMPSLASGLYTNIEVGADVPANYARDIAQLKAEVDAIHRRMQVCLRLPGGVPDARRPNSPNQPNSRQQERRYSPAPSPNTQYPPLTARPVLVGKVIVINRGLCEFDLLLNSQPIRIRGNGRTTIPVSVGFITTQFPRHPKTVQVWNNWQLLGTEYVLRINVCSKIRQSGECRGNQCVFLTASECPTATYEQQWFRRPTNPYLPSTQ